MFILLWECVLRAMNMFVFVLCSVTSVVWSPSWVCGGTVRTVRLTTLLTSAPTAPTGELHYLYYQTVIHSAGRFAP